MKRDDIKAVIPDITDAQLDELMRMYGDGVNAAKKDYDTLKADLAAAADKVAELEKAAKLTDDERKELDDLRSDAEKRKSDEQAAQAKAALDERFSKAAGDAKFINDYTRAAVSAEFAKAVQDESNAGRGDAEIYSEITKDRADIFKNPNAPKDLPKTGDIADGKMSDDDVRRIMGLPIK